MTSAGLSDTELSAFTVIPNGWSPSSAVTTVTPVTKWPMTWRKTSDSIEFITFIGAECRRDPDLPAVAARSLTRHSVARPGGTPTIWP